MMHQAAVGVCFGFLDLFGSALLGLGEFYFKLSSTVQESRGKMYNCATVSRFGSILTSVTLNTQFQTLFLL